MGSAAKRRTSWVKAGVESVTRARSSDRLAPLYWQWLGARCGLSLKTQLAVFDKMLGVLVGGMLDIAIEHVANEAAAPTVLARAPAVLPMVPRIVTMAGGVAHAAVVMW
jgi:hypothetical protein